MVAYIQLIDDRQHLVLTLERVQVHNQGLGRFVQLAGSVEELPTQGPHVLAAEDIPAADARRIFGSNRYMALKVDGRTLIADQISRFFRGRIGSIVTVGLSQAVLSHCTGNVRLGGSSHAMTWACHSKAAPNSYTGSAGCPSRQTTALVLRARPRNFSVPRGRPGKAASSIPKVTFPAHRP